MAPEKPKLCCLLTTPELQRRKATVLKALQQKIVESEEHTDGFAFRFHTTDELMDELAEFIKTERACCPFFVFRLRVDADGGDTWLELSGPEGAKEFIRVELGMLSDPQKEIS